MQEEPKARRGLLHPLQLGVFSVRGGALPGRALRERVRQRKPPDLEPCPTRRGPELSSQRAAQRCTAANAEQGPSHQRGSAQRVSLTQLAPLLWVWGWVLAGLG